MTPLPTLIVERTRGWWILAVVLGTAGSAVSAHMLLNDTAAKPQLMGAIGVVFLGALAIHGLIRLLRRRPALCIDADGIAFPERGFAVTWQEFVSVRSSAGKHQDWLVFELSTPDGLPRGLSALRRWMLRANPLFPPAAVSLLHNGLSLPADRILAEIEARRPAAVPPADPLQKNL